MAPSWPSNGRLVTVFDGDTLWSLAFAYGCSVEELVRANPGMSERKRLAAGAKLRLPNERSPDAPWARLEPHTQRTRADGEAAVASGNMVGAVAVAFGLLAGASVGLRFAPGPAGDAARDVKETAGKQLGGTRPLWSHALCGVGALLQAASRGTAHVLIRTLGGTPNHASAKAPDAALELSANSATVAALRAEVTRSRAEVAEAKARCAAAEAHAATLAKELAAALANVEEMTKAEASQRKLAEAGVQRVQELSRQIAAVRHAAAGEQAE